MPQRLLRAAAAALALAGCALPPPDNQPLAPGERNAGYEVIDLNTRSGRGDLLVLASFSGGGMRSAAFAHGALRGMRQLRVGADGNLLEELDQLAAVSGGSFTAAHYVLNRERHFETFPDAFLRRDIEAYIWGNFLLPWNWRWAVSPTWGTNDRMAEVYDRLLFGGATFGDVIARGRPRLAIGATELASGINWTFLPFPFDLICSDLSQYRIARAVAASAGFPVLFTPITLANHRNADCRSPPPPFPEPAAVAADPRQRQLDQLMRRYADASETPYLHVMDGGIADNLAMRYVLLTLAGGGERGNGFAEQVLRIRRVVLLVVDGQAATDPALSQQRVVSSLGTIVNAVSGGQIDNYNLETLTFAQAEMARTQERQRARRCALGPVFDGRPCDDLDFLLVRIAVSEHPDPAIRARLASIRTALTLPEEDIELLVRAGEEMMQAEGPLARMLRDIDGPPARRAVARRR